MKLDVKITRVKIPYTKANLRRYGLPDLPCHVSNCNRKPKWIIIERGSLFTVIYGACKEHEVNEDGN
jgi:preprotein translocase subunit Sec63